MSSPKILQTSTGMLWVDRALSAFKAPVLLPSGIYYEQISALRICNS